MHYSYGIKRLIVRNSFFPSRTLTIYGNTVFVGSIILALGAKLTDHMGMLFVISMTASVVVAVCGILLPLIYSLHKIYSQYRQANEKNTELKLSGTEVSNLALSLSTFIIFPFSLYYAFTPIAPLFMAPSVIFCAVEVILRLKDYANANVTQPQTPVTKQNQKPTQTAKEHKVLGWQHKAKQQLSKSNHKPEKVDKVKPTERRNRRKVG